ncbi:MAG: c-type cytochrome [Verrucomicrobia bacterium]|nr:c-type cytochrome [Verrucomicrobiota bacterium]
MLAILLSVLSAFAQTDLNSPEHELSTLRVAEGFQANLFAAEPAVVKPIQMQFDPQGRLWVLCTTVYPQLEPGQKPNDRIVILEDTNDDGRADKATEFAGGLMIPTGLALGHGGAYIGHGTELIHLKDTDGDGRADQTRVVLSGFGTGDSHQNINSFTWSPGGELFFCQGHNIYSRIETAEGIRRLDRAGVWRFRPATLQLDSFFHESNGPLNPWGVVFDSWGRPILVDGCCIGIFDLLPVMVPNKPSERYQPLWQGKKICGVDLLSGRHYSDDEQGIMVGGTFFNNAVGRWRLSEDGSGFSAKELPPLIESTNRSFRVVDVKVGPDGAIYLGDWYNPIIGHYQYSFRHPDRDKTHGRIWRVTRKDRPLAPKPKIVGVPLEQLLEHLKAPENYTRNQARRVLAEFPAQNLVPRLHEWVHDLDSKDARYEHHLLEALMLYETLDVVEAGVLVRLLRAEDFRARAYATRVLGRWHSMVQSPWDLFLTQVQDSHPRVRLEAVVALNSVPSARAMEVALRTVDQPMDRFLEYALRQVVQGLKRYWAPAFAADKWGITNHPERLEFLVQADASPDTLRHVVQLLKASALSEAARESLLKLLATVGGPEEVALAFDAKTYQVAGRYDARLHAKILPSIAAAERQRKIRPSGNLAEAVAALLDHKDEALRAEALKLAGIWRIERLRTEMENSALAPEASEPARRAALEGLASLGGEQSRDFLMNLSRMAPSEQTRFTAIARLASVDLNAAATAAADALAHSSGETEAGELVAAFLQRARGADALGKALLQKPPSVDAANLALRFMNSIGRQDASLLDPLRRAAELGSESQPLREEEVKALITEVRTNGDRKRGEAIFRRPEVNCLACHAVGNEGGRIGPDLNSIGTGQPIDFIVGAILTPNKEIKEGYQAFEISTKDGEVLQGYKVREDHKELVLRDVLRNLELRIPPGQIEKQRAIGSLMPSGLVDHLTRAEFRDLLRYLSELGTPQNEQGRTSGKPRIRGEEAR